MNRRHRSQATDLDFEIEDHPLESVKPVAELPAKQADISFDSAGFDFETTADLQPLDEIVGQNRAMSALEVGLGIRRDGYNIFVAGLTGTGKKETIERSLKRRLTDSIVPKDWVYVHNFDNADEPWAIGLAPGRGKQLQKHMAQLVERLKEALPKAFRQQDFSREKEQLSRKYEERAETHTNHLREMAKERGFEVTFAPDGRISFVPLIDGKPAENRQQVDQLPDDEKRRLAEGEKELAREVGKLMQEQRQMMQNLGEEVRGIERQFAGQVVAPMIEAIKESYQDEPRVCKYLDRVGHHVLDNLSDFRQGGQGQQMPPQLAAIMGEDSQPRFLEYQVNVLIDNSQAETAPIVLEEAPTYRNLFGSIERAVDRRGRLVTNFTQIKAGSILRANGGYLVFNIEDAFTEPFVYKNLKRALKSGYIRLESYNPWVPFSTGGLRPEPIPIDTKVVVIGNPMIYYLLRFYDDEFASIFKIKADFGTEMPRGGKEQAQYARFVAGMVKDEQLRPFGRDGVKEIIRFGARRVADKEKLLTRFSEAADLVREADYFARIRNAETVDASHVREALENRVYRSNRIAEKIRELIEQGTLLVDVEGARVGHVNGLAIVNLGDYAFGKPSRVTASVGLGTDGLINIEREAKLSGSTHDKGVLILAGFMRNTYGQREPVTLSASICFEQSYGGVEGDSASSVELFALLSHLADVPVRQDIAVTGSVNQWGRIQAIGGVNEKIEGFYDVCREVGLTGQQGVCIPSSNVRGLVLRDDVRHAIADGSFHIYPIETIDQGLELLTGFRAGSPDGHGTVHGRVASRLATMARTLRSYGRDRETRLVPAGPEQPTPPAPPRIPGDQP
jgi:lon-related putative ATP-dependent protease